MRGRLGLGLTGEVQRPAEPLTTAGRPLEPSARLPLEAQLGHDFSQVRVHTGPGAADSARALGARAYTVGTQVVFGEGQFEPRSERGRALLAHELVHVVQQRGGPAGSELAETSDSAAEREAAAVARGGPARIGVRVPAGAVQRQPLELDASPLRIHPQTDIGAVLFGSGTISGFATNSSAIPAGGEVERIAASIVGLLGQHPGAGVSVIGHTDAVGEEAANVGLGQRRADSVAAALAAAGVPRSAIDATSAGESGLAVQTPRADARNRRVEIVFRPRTLASRLSLGTGTLTPPGIATPQPPPFDPTDFSHLTLPPERPDYFRVPPARPGVPGVGPQIQRRFNEFIDPIIDPIITRFGLPDWMGSALRDAIHSAPGAAGTAALNQAMTQLGVPGDAQAAIRAGVGAAMQTSLDPGETRSEPIRILRPRAGTRPLTEAERFAIEERAGDKLRELGVRADAERRRRIVRAIREAVEYGDLDHLDVVLNRESVGRVDRGEIHIFVSREVERLPVSAP
jgi:outer membrane protein OmpA-like peptidoglycan-associated protein